jgi:hypothetical protein
MSGETKVVFVGIPVLVNVTVSVFVEVGVIIVRYVAGIHPILPSESSTSTQMSLLTTSVVIWFILYLTNYCCGKSGKNPLMENGGSI